MRPPRHPKKPRKSRDTHDPQTHLPEALLEELSVSDAVTTTNSANAAPSRKQARKMRRMQKKRDAVQATERWRTRRSSHISADGEDDEPQQHRGFNADGSTERPRKRVRVEGENIQNAKNVRESNGDSPVQSSSADEGKGIKFQNSTADEEASSDDGLNEQVRRVTVEKPKKKRGQGKVKERELMVDPDSREARRLEKLLGIDGKRKKKAAVSTSTTEYKNLFTGFDDDLLDLMEFCDRRKWAQPNDTHLAPEDDAEASDDDLQDNSDEEITMNQEALDCEENEGPDADVSMGSDGQFLQNSDSSEAEGESEGESEDEAPRSIVALEPEQAGSKIDAERDDEGSLSLSEDESPTPNRRSSNGSGSGKSEIAESPPAARARVAATKPTGKYVPPSARQRMDRSNDALRRRVRGLLNRVADANAQGVADSLIALFRSPDIALSKRDQADLYANCALDACRDGSGVGQVNPYVQSHAAIASHLGRQLDCVFLASVIVGAVRRTASVLRDSSAEDGERHEDSNDLRGAFGFTAMLCALHAKRSVSTKLVYNYVKFVADPLSGMRLELLLFLLRQAGPILRMDDPVGLKDLIIFIREKTDELKETSSGVSNNTYSEAKLQIMLDLVSDIKNNKVRKSVLKDNLAKFEWADIPEVPLSASVKDLLDDDFVSVRWWDETKGLSIAERRGLKEKTDSHGSVREVGVTVDVNGDDPDLGTLASSLRLNTDFRKTIFKAVMSSVSVSDAVSRLEMMGALHNKSGRDKDTALVILLCCISERTFNPFYALLAEKLCGRFRSFRFSFEFALWDTFKTIPKTNKTAGMSKRKRRNLALMLTHLWATGALSLSVLRCATDFDKCDVTEKGFYAEATASLMTRLLQPKTDQAAPFTKLLSETWSGVEHFRISFGLFLRREVTVLLSADERWVLSRGVKHLERAKN